MKLEPLVNYYECLAEQGEVSREGWCQAKVSYAINLSEEGKITGILSLKGEDEKKRISIPQMITVPEMVTRSSGVSANFLCDNAKYMLGIDADGTNPRTQECFQAAKERHLSLLWGVEGPMARAICRYFEEWNPLEAKSHPEIQENWEELTAGGNLIFSMGMNYAQEDSFIREAWENARNVSGKTEEGICLVTGKRSEIARIHKSIKGVPGAQSSGAALISFNAPAFESYGKEQSYNAPVGKYAEFAYTTALNYLLSQREYVFQLGDSMILFWAEGGEEAYQDAFFQAVVSRADNQEELKEIFGHLKNQEPIFIQGISLNPQQRFYILGLAPNAARLSVRFFYESSFGNILKNLSRHYERMELVRPVWETREYLGVRDMLFETVNPKSKDKSPVPNMAAMVLRSILQGAPYPERLYADTLIRIRAEQGNVTWGRAAIVKAYLIQNRKWEKGAAYMEVNTEEMESKAYVLGRLFSVLEAIQREANPTINATIRDRYFNSACATPASVFPVLVKLKNSHMKKLEREKGWAKPYYEQLLTEILGKLGTEFPRRLSLEDQGKFILGYYQQTQRKYKKQEEK